MVLRRDLQKAWVGTRNPKSFYLFSEYSLVIIRAFLIFLNSARMNKLVQNQNAA